MFVDTELSTSFYLSVTGLCKSSFWGFSSTNLKFSVNVCSFLGLSSVEIKSDDGYQIGRRISSVDDQCPGH